MSGAARASSINSSLACASSIFACDLTSLTDVLAASRKRPADRNMTAGRTGRRRRRRRQWQRRVAVQMRRQTSVGGRDCAHMDSGETRVRYPFDTHDQRTSLTPLPCCARRSAMGKVAERSEWWQTETANGRHLDNRMQTNAKVYQHLQNRIKLKFIVK